MSLPAHRPAVAGDLLDLPEDRGFEILGGDIVEKAAPSGEHADAQAALLASIRPRFHRRGGGDAPGGWWSLVECEVELAPHDVLRPDVVGWRRERVPDRPTGFPIRERPDWIGEVLSPSTADWDLGPKMRLLHAHRIPHYWIADPEHRVLTVHRWSEAGYVVVRTAGVGETVNLEPFEALDLDVGLIFGVEEG